MAIDYFTNWVEIGSLLKSMTAEEVIRAFFKIIISHHGCTERLHSDSGSTFVTEAVYSLCECFNIKKEESTPYEKEMGKLKNLLDF